MFLKSIHLRQFRCHEDLHVDFITTDAVKNPVRKTTFITGKNGSGKSALLQAIAMVTGGTEALRRMPGFPDRYIRQNQMSAELSAVITTAQGEERHLKLELVRGESLRDALRRARGGLAPIDAALRHTARSYFVAGFGSGRRIGNRYNARDIRPIDRPAARYAAVQSLFNRDALLRPLPDWAADMRERSGTDALTALGAAINAFLPEEVRFESIDLLGNVLFKTPDGLLPLDDLSDGYQQTLAWVGDLLYHISSTFGDYKNPLKARGLLLIDEADLHLHAAWQQQLYRFLEEGLPQFQVIATTNSPATAAAAKTGEVLRLERQSDGQPLILPVAA
jgi:predicted ATP-binding protein involved in virulence